MELIEKKIVLKDGIELKLWHSAPRPLPWLISVHGIAEHSGRHHYLRPLLEQSYNIIFFDLRGHGRSEGARGDIGDFDQYRQDLIEIIQWAKKELSIEDYSLHAHSMGSLIVANFIQKGSIDNFSPKKVFLSAPPAGASGILGPISDALPASFFKWLAKFAHKISGRFLINNDFLSHNPQVAIDFSRDQYNLKDPSLHLVLEIAACYKQVFSAPLNIHFDFHCVIGSEDCLVTTKNLIHYFKTIEAGRSFKVIPGAYHELHNELPEIQSILFNELKKFFL